MRIAAGVEPCLIVESDCIHHQRIFIPLTNRISKPGRIEERRMRAAIGENLAIVVELLEQDRSECRRLYDLEGNRNQHRAGQPMRQTAARGKADAEAVDTLLVECLRPWLQGNGSAVR